MFFSFLHVAFGSALGGMARYLTSIVSLNLFGSSFPYGTFIVNIVGSFIIGVFAALSIADTSKFYLNDSLQKFLMVGFCGGFTTFSSFSLDTFKLIENNEFLKAGAYCGMSFALCLISVFAGYYLAYKYST